MNSVTDKQRIAIKNVSTVLGIQFTGVTKQDAFLWLQENMPKATAVAHGMAVNHQTVSLRSIHTAQQYEDGLEFMSRVRELGRRVDEDPLDLDSLNDTISELSMALTILSK